MVRKFIPTSFEEREEDEVEVVNDWRSTYTRIKYATPNPTRTAEEYDYDHEDDERGIE